MTEKKLGVKAKDKVTGFTGILVARTEWLNGCVRVTLQPPMDKDGKIPESGTFDEPQIEVVGKGVQAHQAPTGGPLPFKPMQARGPVR